MTRSGDSVDVWLLVGVLLIGAFAVGCDRHVECPALDTDGADYVHRIPNVEGYTQTAVCICSSTTRLSCTWSQDYEPCSVKPTTVDLTLRDDVGAVQLLDEEGTTEWNIPEEDVENMRAACADSAS